MTKIAINNVVREMTAEEQAEHDARQQAYIDDGANRKLTEIKSKGACCHQFTYYELSRQESGYFTGANAMPQPVQPWALTAQEVCEDGVSVESHSNNRSAATSSGRVCS